MKTKSIFASKTFWVNILLAAIAIVPEVANLPNLQISKEWLAFIVVVANIILRMVTQSKATLTGQ